MIRHGVAALLSFLALCVAVSTHAEEEHGDRGEHAEQHAARPLSEANAAAGKPLYLRECSGCHGDRGNGRGPAADFVEPRPRDFTKAQFKFRTTAPGQPPATADVLRVIERGIPGTAMPSFAFLPADERQKIAAYVLKLADLLDGPEPPPLVIPSAAATSSETIAKGKTLYADLGCASCHGDLGKGDGQPELKDADGRPSKPRDFTSEHFRGGGDRADLAHRIAGGMDGTPMPSYNDSLETPADVWALADYVLSLRAPAMAKPRAAAPIAAGREVAAKFSCGGCHVLDDGKGGDVGPDLRVSGQKLDSNWVRAFLKSTREYGKIYPWRVYRMPQLALSDEEIEVMTTYLATVGKRAVGPVDVPDPATFPPEKVEQGKLLYVVRCTECHNLGTAIPTLPIKQQGPDLILVPHRVDFEWAKRWIQNPKAIDPKTKMVGPDLTPEQVEAVRMFVWKTAIDAGAKPMRAATAH
jgi:mono/diheme cytochrome c family protein